MGVEGEQAREVDEGEDGQDEIGASAPNERERKPGRSDQERWAEPVPQPRDERERRRLVVLEPEPARMRRLLNPPGVTCGLAEVEKDVRARRGEGEQRPPARDREAPPPPPGRDDERGEQQDAGV